MSDPTPFWLTGHAATAPSGYQVRHPYDDSVVATVANPTTEQVEAAVSAAADVAEEFAGTPAHQRAAALDAVGAALRERAEEAAALITAESGKPIKWARLEVTRGLSTLRFAAEEARRFSGEFQRLDTDPAATGRAAINRRFPRGPVLGIAPFNFPLNLVLHKLAPAIAVGAPIIVKPSPRTPLSALLLGELFADTELPAGAISVLPIDNDRVGALTHDPRLPVVSFTGSVPVGWGIARAVPEKQVLLELGGNAAAVIAPDYLDIEFAATRIATFGNYQAGQSCISVQRVLIDRPRFAEISAAIVAKVQALRLGDPRDESTDVGPVIDGASADRISEWITLAVDSGAQLLLGGGRIGNTLEPVVLSHAPETAKVNAEEVFGPVLSLIPYDTIDDAFALVNAGKFGLQAGVFTTEIATAFAAHRQLKVGGVIIGDVPSYRADQMPYGGAKASGVGREGVKYAMTDFTEERVLVLTGLQL